MSTRRRWDVQEVAVKEEKKEEDDKEAKKPKSEWDEEDELTRTEPTTVAAAQAGWETPVAAAGAGETLHIKRRNRWDETPVNFAASASGVMATPVATTKGRSRWDETPVNFGAAVSGAVSSSAALMTPVAG
jgi:hypothetical protein